MPRGCYDRSKAHFKKRDKIVSENLIANQETTAEIEPLHEQTEVKITTLKSTVLESHENLDTLPFENTPNCSVKECLNSSGHCMIVEITGKVPKSRFSCSYFKTQKDADRREKKLKVAEGTVLKKNIKSK